MRGWWRLTPGQFTTNFACCYTPHIFKIIFHQKENTTFLSYFSRHMMFSHKRIGYFFLPSSRSKHRGCESTLKTFLHDRERKHSLFFSPLPSDCVEAAAFSLFRITLPVFPICCKQTWAIPLFLPQYQYPIFPKRP